MRRSVAGTALALSTLALSLVGCHKQTQRVSTPQAPPSTMPTPGPPSRAQTPPPARPIPPPPAMTGKPDAVEVGLASWYGPLYNNRPGADGTVYDQNAMTAAHKTLPLGSMVRVTNLANNQTVVVRITDRGPFVGNRIIDLSLAAAKLAGVYGVGVAQVRLEAYVPPPKPGVEAGGRWCVQIGAFLTAEDAIQLKNDLTRRYVTAKVIEFAGPTGYWVRINARVTDKQHAEQIAASIHVPDAEAFLVRTD